MRKFMILALLLIILGGTVFTAWAGLHFVGGLNAYGGSLHVDGKLVGYGGEMVTVSLYATGDSVAICENPSGKRAPGRNPITAGTSTVQDSFVTESNGNALVQLVVHEDAIESAAYTLISPSPKDAGCPNGKWSVVDAQIINWTSAVVTVTVNGAVVQTHNFTCSGVGAGTTCW